MADHSAPGSEASSREPSNRSLHLLLDNLHDVVFRLRLRPKLSFEYLSPAAEAISGYSREEWLADPGLLMRAVEPGDRSIVEEALNSDEMPHREVLRFRRRDGSTGWIEAVRRTEFDEAGQPVAVEGVVRDVTERIENLHEARRAQALFESAFDQAPVGIGLTSLELDEVDRLVAVNPAICALLGRTREELLSRPLDDFTHPEDRGRSVVLKEQLLKGEIPSFYVQKRYVRGDGSILWGALHGTIVRDTAGRPIHGLGYLVDVSERVAYEHELRYQALHDPLTGLPNRRLFTDRLEHALSSRKEQMWVGLLFADIDDLKSVNDTHGHAAGDAVIREIADRFAAAVRPSDTVARLSGDEFAVLCPELPNPDAVLQVADRMLSALQGELVVGGASLPLGARIGATSVQMNDARPDALLAEADMALLHAKAAGSGRLRVYDQQLGRAMRARREHEREVREAVANHQFELHYQPIVDMASREPVAAEALVRWRHPSGELRPPAMFLDTAEQLALIDDVDRWVLDQVCRDYEHVRRAAPRISVNLHPTALGSGALVASVAELLQETGHPGEILCFEITERAVIGDPEAAMATIAGLRHLGCSVALDDFGAGFSSLSQLAALPVDILKLDRAFVADLSGPEDRRSAIVGSVVTMADALDMLLIAEGVETEAQHELLLELGCPHGQGYLYGRPSPLDD